MLLYAEHPQPMEIMREQGEERGSEGDAEGFEHGQGDQKPPELQLQLGRGLFSPSSFPSLPCLATGTVKPPPPRSLSIYSNASELSLPSWAPRSGFGARRRDGRLCLHLQGNLLIKATEGTALFPAAGTDGGMRVAQLMRGDSCRGGGFIAGGER